MSFSEIERVLGFKLPKSAYQHEAWWSNNATGHSHAKRVAQVRLAHRSGRSGAAQGDVSALTAPPLQLTPAPRGDPWGCMAGTVTFMPGVDLTEPNGERWNAEEGRLLNE